MSERLDHSPCSRKVVDVKDQSRVAVAVFARDREIDLPVIVEIAGRDPAGPIVARRETGAGQVRDVEITGRRRLV